jgi:hypothetical protein
MNNNTSDLINIVMVNIKHANSISIEQEDGLAAINNDMTKSTVDTHQTDITNSLTLVECDTNKKVISPWKSIEDFDNEDQLPHLHPDTQKEGNVNSNEFIKNNTEFIKNID